MLKLLHSFKFKNYELNMYDYESFDDYLFEFKINGFTNAIGFEDNFDDSCLHSNNAVCRFHKLTKGVYKDELKNIKKCK